jgi:hypothetical protein
MSEVPDPLAGIPDRVTVRLDDDLRSRIAAFMRANDVEQLASAVRIALDAGLGRLEELEQDFIKRLIKEGFNSGYHTFFERLAQVAAEIRAETKQGSVQKLPPLERHNRK